MQKDSRLAQQYPPPNPARTRTRKENTSIHCLVKSICQSRKDMWKPWEMKHPASPGPTQPHLSCTLPPTLSGVPQTCSPYKAFLAIIT